MNKQILFLQGGGGQDDYDEDAKLVESLRSSLGLGYTIHYPLLTDSDEPDFGRIKQIENAISIIEDEIILVGHSLGASMILKYLSEDPIKIKITGIFLIATPFWDGHEEWVNGIKLKENFADNLPKDIPIFLYHCVDDSIVPIEHLEIYTQKMPNAVICKLDSGDHHFDNNLSLVAKDIKTLKGN
ncbi:MAG TPA: alpha/beta hydrolase [Saprospiraceae bacterium]|nr:alpha/beta hydrolase [Saprospiraceae bacterium]HPN68728.1 alpha/beta hydrolase [Saprospiraceae bacterium]